MPETKAAMTMTVIVPTTTPRIVRNDRSLCCHNVSKAIMIFSRKSPIFIPVSLFALDAFPFGGGSDSFRGLRAADPRVAGQNHLTRPERLLLKIRRGRRQSQPGRLVDFNFRRGGRELRRQASIRFDGRRQPDAVLL